MLIHGFDFMIDHSAQNNILGEITSRFPKGQGTPKIIWRTRKKLGEEKPSSPANIDGGKELGSSEQARASLAGQKTEEEKKKQSRGRTQMV